MKTTPIRLGFLLLAACLSAQALERGETYEKVVSELGKPEATLEAGATKILKYPGGSVKLKDGVVVEIKGSPAANPAAASAPAAPAGSAAALTYQMNQAFEAVRRIVNQRPRSVPITPGINVEGFGDAYFHPGAITPDFATVDVRATQQLVYDKYEYVSSNMNPGIAFIGRQLEFNPMTKYFYTDRTVPKKRLTEPEMLEINRLYRVIGRCQSELAALKK